MNSEVEGLRKKVAELEDRLTILAAPNNTLNIQILATNTTTDMNALSARLTEHALGDNPMNAVLLGGGSMVLAGLCIGVVSKDVDNASERASSPSPQTLVQERS